MATDKIASIPDGEELLYLRSTGTQYIDLGFAPNQDTRVVCRARVPNISGTNWLFGARRSSSADLFTFALSANNYFVLTYGTKKVNLDKAYNSTKELTVTMGGSEDLGEYSVDTEHGVVEGSLGTPLFTCPCNLTLFAGNTNGQVGYGQVYIFSFDVYDTSVFPYIHTMSLVPWKRSDGQVGMLDKLSGQFYANAGTGEFQYAVAYDETSFQIGLIMGLLANGNPSVTPSDTFDANCFNKGYAAGLALKSAKPVEPDTPVPEPASSRLRAAGGYVLKDVNKVYLVPKEDK